jgi:DNA-binding GntR family transcriptional regulator
VPVKTIKQGADRAGTSLADTAYRAIEDLIVRLELAPGLAVSEADLMRRLGIGRTPIREALHRLAREGMVVIAPRRGVFVTDIRVDAQLRLLETRRGLERLMAGRAARLANADERAAFLDIATGLVEAGRTGAQVEFLMLHQAFNLKLGAVGRNEFAAAAFGLTAGLSRRFWVRHEALADLALTANLHAEVAGAIAAGDPAKAEAASDALVDYLERFTRSVFEHVL